MKFIVLCSSNGTTFQAAIDAMKNGSLTAKCLGLITDKPDRGCIQKAQAANLPIVVVQKNQNENAEDYNKRLTDAAIKLSDNQPQKTVIAALGWMYIIAEPFLSIFHNRIINVHPSLLPKFGGKGMTHMKVHQSVLEQKEAVSGITIHLINEKLDDGKILLQKTCDVLPHDTAETLKTKVQAMEKEWYPKVLQMIEDGELGGVNILGKDI